jgi:spore coat polysaccharide biosynthesis predicted glycosyltransferase SpsG
LNKPANILICPLEWGLGHAARMIPLAKRLTEMNNKVIIASGPEHLSLFRSELPGLSYISFPGFKPGYSRYLPQYISILFKVPLLLWHIVKEHQRVKRIIKENEIDIIISDNRFGLWNKKVISVYITHMPRIPLPKSLRFLEPAGIMLHSLIIKKYTYCFIPDLPGDLNLSGKLSHGLKLPANVRYIGILSKYSGQSSEISNIGKHDTVILSGPEPQREILKQKLISILKDDITPTIMFEGKPESEERIKKTGNITFYSHLPASEMKKIIESSLNIISRSGYTTIMELVSLNCTALLIPTPGQTEQEYLADYLSEKGWFYKLPQNEIKTELMFHDRKINLQGEINRQSHILLTNALKELSDNHHKNSKSEKPGK